MGRKKLTYGYAPNVPILCSICGDKARGNNFSVLSCVSCKSFFRRHGLLDTENLQCRYQGRCIITKETRSDCLPCRLKKCIESGMDPLKIRCPLGIPTSLKRTQQTITTTDRQFQLPMPRPLNLLRNDCSTLTSDQWNLLSNIIRSYDEQDLNNKAMDLLVERSSLPPKLRLKLEDTFKLMMLPLENLLPLVEHSPHFRCLSRHAYRALVLHNMFFTSSLSGSLIARETNAFLNLNCMYATSEVYGSDFMIKCAEDNKRLVANGNIIKLMLFVLIFSSNFSIVMFNNPEDLEIMSSSIELVHAQNIYVMILWKYLVYLYGENGAVMHFSLLVKNVIDMFTRTTEVANDIVSTIYFDRTIIHMTRLLSIKDGN